MAINFRKKMKPYKENLSSSNSQEKEIEEEQNNQDYKKYAWTK